MFEVLISMVILSVALVFITRSLLSSLKAVRTSSSMFRAGLMLEERLWEYEAAGGIPVGKNEGEFEGTGREFMWAEESVKVDELPINDVKLVVRWKEGNLTRHISVETYLWESGEE